MEVSYIPSAEAIPPDQPQTQQIYWGFQGKSGWFMYIPAVACELHNLPHAYIGAVYFPKYMTDYWRSENTTRPFTVSVWSISSCSVQPVVFSTLPKQKNLPNCSGADPQNLTNWGQWQPNNGARGGNSTHRSTQFTKKIFRRSFQMWTARRLHCRGATVLGGGDKGGRWEKLA